MSEFDLDNTDFPQTPIPEKIPSRSRMINGISDITSENPIQEIWKLLRFFKDANFCKKYHCQYLGISQEDYVQNKSNINKQVEQIGYCIRQAEEYFKASSQVGLATRPNLLYYGAVSLSKALILLRQDGKHSLDWLRNKEKHQHHGLTLKRAFKDTDKVISVKDFFETIQCKCYYQEIIDTGTGQKKMIPWGHFPLLYESLAPNFITVNADLTETDRISQLRSPQVVNASEILPI